MDLFCQIYTKCMQDMKKDHKMCKKKYKGKVKFKCPSSVCVRFTMAPLKHTSTLLNFLDSVMK